MYKVYLRRFGPNGYVGLARCCWSCRRWRMTPAVRRNERLGLVLAVPQLSGIFAQHLVRIDPGGFSTAGLTE